MISAYKKQVESFCVTFIMFFAYKKKIESLYVTAL